MTHNGFHYVLGPHVCPPHANYMLLRQWLWIQLASKWPKIKNFLSDITS